MTKEIDFNEIKPLMKLKIPKCEKCKALLEPQFITELDEDDKVSEPKFLILFGACEKCKVTTVCNIIDVEELIQKQNERDKKK